MILDELPVAVPADDNSWVARAQAIGPGGRVHVVRIDQPDGLTIDTHRKSGWRYDPFGRIFALDLHPEDTARQAALQVLPDSPHLAPEADRLGRLVHDRTVSATVPLRIEHDTFVLFVLTTGRGQAAVADLGPIRPALHGPRIPDALTLGIRALTTLPLAERRGPQARQARPND